MDFTNPHFAARGWLWLAVLGPAVFGLICIYAARGRARQLNAIAAPELQPHLLRSHSPARRTAKNILIALALAGIGLALARPQWGRSMEAKDLRGEDLMLVLDCSKSMLTTDVRPNRFERARLAILDFVQSHPGGRIGLVAFAGAAFIQCPLTFDYDAFRECLMAVDEKSIPIQGTDLARALEEASKGMEKDARRKVVILVTDGEDLERAGVLKAQELATNGVIVHTIGVGTGEGKLVQAIGDRGMMEILRDPQGQAVTSKLDETTLRAIATMTGGTYQPLGSTGQGLAQVRDSIRFDTSRGRQGDLETAGIDRFYFFLAAVLVLLTVESLVGTRRRIAENTGAR